VCFQPSEPARNDTQRIIAADTEPGSWLTHGRTYGEQRFSPLTKVSIDTVGQLGLAWTYEMRTNRGMSATPLVVDGVMYVTSAWSDQLVDDLFLSKDGKRLFASRPSLGDVVAIDLQTRAGVVNRCRRIPCGPRRAVAQGRHATCFCDESPQGLEGSVARAPSPRSVPWQ
jgi:glucose dehydrogenase